MGKHGNQKIYRNNNPTKIKARKIVYSAIRNKSIISKPCVECNNKKTEAHHEDYDKPLEIIWLCKKHHIVYDKKLKEKFSTGK